MAVAAFDLTTSPWLPCRTGDGTVVELGLRDLLIRSPELVDLAVASPLTRAALLRMLLALLYAVHDGPRGNPERAEWWRQGGWDATALDGYLKRQAGRFDLFDNGHPFWQEPGLELPVADTVARLAPELASGNNTLLFDHSLDEEPPALSAAEAARWLVTHQLYGLGGGKGPTSNKHRHPYASHAPAAMGASLFLRGSNLFETLLLNLVPLDRGDLTRPIWERDFPPPEPVVPAGLPELLTWPNRSVRLLPEMERGKLVVRRVYTAQGAVCQAAESLRDPYFARRQAKEGTTPLRVTAGRALWRDSAALFGFQPADVHGEVDTVPRPIVFQRAGELLELLDTAPARLPCFAVGMDFNQSKINLWRLDELTLPEALLRDDDRARDLADALQSAVEQADQTADALRLALRAVAERMLKPNSDRAGSTERADPKQVAALLGHWRGDDHYWAALDQPFTRLLATLPDDREGAVAAWQQACQDAAEAAFRTTTEALGGSSRVLRARVRGRQAVTRDWRRHAKKGATA